MKSREFVYIGSPAQKIEKQGNADFVTHLQKSMLLSLVKRGLLTSAQMDSVMAKLEK